MTARHDQDVDVEQLRAQLRRLAETVEPVPGYLERLRPRLRPARRHHAAAAAAAAGLAAAIAATAVVVGPLVRDRQPTGPAPPGLPRTMFVAASEQPPQDARVAQLRRDLERATQARDQARADQLRRELARTMARMEQSQQRQRRALLRVDAATGKVLAVPYRTQGRNLAWALGDDGTAVVETGESKCAFDLHAFAPDGRETDLGPVPGFEGSTGSSLASFALSPDGRLLAVTGTSCPDPKREGALHWRVAVYRVGAKVDPNPMVSFTVPDRRDGTFSNPADPSFSSDGGHVVFPFEAGQGSFDPARGASGHVVEGFLDVDLAHPARTPATRTLRPSGAGCLVSTDGLAFGSDPAKLTALQGCAGRQQLVEVDLASGRAVPKLTVPAQPALFHPDYDASRTHLLLEPGRSQLDEPARLVEWDGGRSLRPVVELKEVRLDGVTYVVGGAEW
jgi:hypothetical protein